MNAHINFDLGIAAAEVAPDRDSLDSLKHDFDEINQVLAEEAFGVEKMLVDVSPLLKLVIGAELLDRNRIVNFDMGKARACAWQAAIGLVGDPAGRGVRTTVLDAATALLGNALLYPPPTLALELAPVRAAEKTDVRSAIEVLAGARPQGAAN